LKDYFQTPCTNGFNGADYRPPQMPGIATVSFLILQRIKHGKEDAA
jgi:hypothetical protein